MGIVFLSVFLDNIDKNSCLCDCSGTFLIQVNVDGVKNVISAVRQTATIKKLIYVSSFFALGPSDGKVADESQVTG